MVTTISKQQESAFLNMGGQEFRLPNGQSVFRATDSMQSSIQGIADDTRNAAMQAQGDPARMSDSCGDGCAGGGCGFDSSYIMLDIRRTNIPQSTGIFDLNTGMGWMNSVQTFYETPRFTAPRTLCCTNDFPIHERPDLCCDTTTISTFYMAWRSCIHEKKFICGGANGFQEWNPQEAQLQTTAIESMSLFASLLAFNGDTANNIIGLANNPKIMTAPAPSLVYAPAEMIMDSIANFMSMLRMWESINVTPDGNYSAQNYLWLIPSMYYDHLSVRTWQGKRLLDWIEGGGCCETNTLTTQQRPTYRLKVIPVPELNAHGEEARPVGYIMRYGDLEWIRPYFTVDGVPATTGGSPYSILPPQRDGLFVTTIAWFRAGSVLPRAFDRLIRTVF